ncbi:pyridoxal phosphate-dependent aminotransferase [Mycolicibacterium baixiangningiae]|uniref:pyridoxal phosphate-dependent aminotransferase n=1 Tax=Mycolicibacterium baixiangningiae TaxID=2761578 RepID=UPI0018D06C62|nr:pyridoxal phosphate-dependent aminotransferase [Mycolicibacterium baixiangningiae]
MTDAAVPLSGLPSFEDLLGRDDVVWMGQNTTHLAPPGEVIDALDRSIRDREFQFYAPAAGFEELRTLIAEDLGLPGADVWVTDGAVGGLHHICTAMAPRISRLIATDPGWPWPARFVAGAGVPVTVLPVYHNRTRMLEPAQLAEVIEHGSMIYLIDPLNPLGSSYTRDELTAVTDLARATESYVIHDCTYRHFADGHTLAAELYPERTLTTYSFSKWLGLAGLRVGAIVATPELLGELTQAPANPLGAGIVAQRAAIAGLHAKTEWLQRLRATNRSNLAAVEDAVSRSGWGRVVVTPSQGNFLAIDLEGSRWGSEALCQHLLRDSGVFIRPGTYQSPAFGERFVKVSTSVPPDWADRFCAAWQALGSGGAEL